MVVPEAMAAGMPVVGSNQTGSIIDIGEHDCLRIFDSGSVKDFSRQVAWFLDNVESVPALGSKACKVAQAYNSMLGAERFSELISTVLRK